MTLQLHTHLPITRTCSSRLDDLLTRLVAYRWGSSSKCSVQSMLEAVLRTFAGISP